MACKTSIVAIGFLLAIISVFSSVTVNADGIWAKLSGKIIGGPLRFNGAVNFGVANRRGKDSGRLNTGSRCLGNAWINILFSRGGGTMKCKNGLSTKYTFSLSSRFPVKGMGKGVVNDGRKAVFTINPLQ